MNLLPLLPRCIVIAMQASLVALVLLATVPIAMGGVNVDVKQPAELNYADYELTLTMAADVSADLYFDLTGFRYGVHLVSGDSRLFISGEDLGTVHDTAVEVDAAVPLVTLVMMMLRGASYDCDTSISVNIGGSTLGGMISGTARADIPIADNVGGSISVNGDLSALSAHIIVSRSDLLLQIFGPGVTIQIGDLICTIAFTDNGDTFDISVAFGSSSGRPLTDIINDSRKTDGSVDVYYDGAAAKELKKEYVDFTICVLELLHGRHGA